MESDGENSAAGATRAAFDLSALSIIGDSQEAGASLSLTDPKTGDDVGIILKIVGPDSKRMKKTKWRLMRERVELRIRKVPDERLEYEGLQVVAAAVIGWEPITFNSKPFEYTEKNVIKLLTDFPIYSPHWREQIDTFSGDRANFIKS